MKIITKKHNVSVSIENLSAKISARKEVRNGYIFEMPRAYLIIVEKVKAKVRKVFRWIHLKLTNLENRILSKLDSIGYNIHLKLEDRLGFGDDMSDERIQE